jgi:glycosyltransferase involved in cell wall biosynthesis
VVANGVPIPEKANEHSANTHNVKVLFLGNLCQRKGVWDLIAAVKNVDGIILDLVGGEEDPGISQKVADFIKQEGLEGKVNLLGPKIGADKSAILENAEIFVLPSYAEGLPISLLEAMAIGLPIIVTPVGGIPSTVTDGEDCLLVPPGNITSLTEAIVKLAGDPALRRRLGNAARIRCIESFGVENAVANICKIYSELYPEFGVN